MNETVRYYVKKKQLDNPHNEPTPMYSVSLSIHPLVIHLSVCIPCVT